MGCFNGPTSKRHKLWSGSKSVLEEIIAGATFMSKAIRLQLPGTPLVHKYVDKKGKKRYAGIPHALKASQTLVVASEMVLVIFMYIVGVRI